MKLMGGSWPLSHIFSALLLLGTAYSQSLASSSSGKSPLPVPGAVARTKHRMSKSLMHCRSRKRRGCNFNLRQSKLDRYDRHLRPALLLHWLLEGKWSSRFHVAALLRHQPARGPELRGLLQQIRLPLHGDVAIVDMLLLECCGAPSRRSMHAAVQLFSRPGLWRRHGDGGVHPLQLRGTLLAHFDVCERDLASLDFQQFEHGIAIAKRQQLDNSGHHLFVSGYVKLPKSPGF